MLHWLTRTGHTVLSSSVAFRPFRFRRSFQKHRGGIPLYDPWLGAIHGNRPGACDTERVDSEAGPVADER
jgi:hypothetical protein